MILAIIFWSLFALFVLYLIFCLITGLIDDDGPAVILCILGGISIIGNLIIGGILISARCHDISEAYRLDEQVKYYMNEKEMLENVKPIIAPDGTVTGFTSDIYIHFDNPTEYYKAVTKYNQEVKEFIISVKSNKAYAENPFISWFYSTAYTNYDWSKLDNLQYTIGK